MAVFCQLRVVERLVGALEIGAAVLPVGVEEQRIEARVEIIMMRDVSSRAPGRVETLQPAPNVADQPVRSQPGRRRVPSLRSHHQRQQRSEERRVGKEWSAGWKT